MSSVFEIFVPDRIGDAILSVPALVCLKQLQQTYRPTLDKVRLYVPRSVHSVFTALNLFETRVLKPSDKLRSWLQPADHAVFLYSSHQYWGFYAKQTYGWKNPAKRLLHFTNHLPYLKLEHCERELPAALVRFLKENHGFSTASIRYFGLCLTLGYTLDQVLEVFEWDPEQVAVRKPKYPSVNIAGAYFVFCIEASYGSKRETQRRWDADDFVTLAQRVYQTLQIPVVFIGLDTHTPLPNTSYFYDLRGKLSMDEVFGLLQHAQGYAGNDSGPLHLANLAQTHTFGVYLSTTPENYGPIFPHRHFSLQNPSTSQEALESFTDWLNELGGGLALEKRLF